LNIVGGVGGVGAVGGCFLFQFPDFSLLKIGGPSHTAEYKTFSPGNIAGLKSALWSTILHRLMEQVRQKPRWLFTKIDVVHEQTRAQTVDI
jgi:hypothetical protein